MEFDPATANVGALGADATGRVSPIPLPTIIDSAFGMMSISTTCCGRVTFVPELLGIDSTPVILMRRAR